MAQNKSKPVDDDSAIVPAEEQTTAVQPARSGTPILSVVNIADGGFDAIPDLDKMEAAPLDLSSEYWAPESPGETRNLLFSHFDTSLVPDKYGKGNARHIGDEGDEPMIPLESAFFFSRKGDQITLVRQASKVLLTTLKNIGVTQGTMIRVVYKGKKKLSNGNTGDDWSVFPLVAKK
jgi:hypothetical protein